MSISDSSDGRMRRASGVSQRRRLRRASILLIGGVLATLVSACGASDDTAGQTPNSITFASAPFDSTAPIYIADKQGYFKDEGLDATIKTFQTSAVSLVLSGQVEFAVTASTQVDQQRSNNVPIKMVTGLSYIGKDTSSQTRALVVKDDSAIRSASDLAGKTIGLPGVQNLAELVMRKWLELNGADASTVKFVNLELPAQMAALKTGDIDVAFLSEPFLSQAKQEGNRVLAYPYVEAKPGATDITVVASDKYLQSHGDVAAKVVRALDKACEYANAHPDAVRAVLTEVAELPTELAGKVSVPPYGTEINSQGVEDEIDQMVELGWIKDRPSLEDLIWSGK